jgi:cytidylate kinase
MEKPMTTNNLIITISREHGSGGGAIAQEVAQILKVPYVDSHLVRLATQRLGVPAEKLMDFDERCIPQLEAISQALTKPAFQFDIPLSEVLVRRRNSSKETSNAATAVKDTTLQQDAAAHKKYHEFMRLIIQDIANKGSAVIVGRGSQFILKDHPYAIHVHIFAPLANRIRRLMELQALSQTEAEHKIQEDDAQRAYFISHYFEADWRNPANYDLMLNTAHISLTTAAKSIVQMARELRAQPVQPQAEINTTYERLRHDSYSLQETAELFHINADVLSQAVYSGELRAPVVDHHIQRISRTDLSDWLKHHFK